MDLRDYFDLFRKWLWLMLLATVNDIRRQLSVLDG